MAFTRKLPSGKIQGIAVHPSGRRVTKTFALTKQARAWAQEQEAIWRRDGSHDPRAGEIRLEGWSRTWLAARVVERATMDRNLVHLRKYVLPQWGTWPLASITRLEVGAWIARLERDEVGATTIEGVVQLLSAMLTAAVEAGRIPANPAARQSLPKRSVKPPRYLDREQAGLLLAELPAPWDTACDLDLHLGLRLGELLGLKVGAVDWARAELHVRGAMTRWGWRAHAKSTKSHRTVPLPPHLLDALTPFVLGRGREEFVFAAPEGGPLRDENFRNRIWFPALTTAGLCEPHKAARGTAAGCKACERCAEHRTAKLVAADCERCRRCPDHRATAADCEVCTPVPRETPHVMRHTAASWLVMDGVDLYRVQALLGHESFATTQRYAHLMPDAHDRIREAWKRMHPAAD